MTELVSVVVPVYNPRKDFLKKCLESIEKQNYDNIELIVVDDSPSSTHEDMITEMTDMELKFINNEENKGISESRNIGIAESEGEYITILDQDDYIHPNKIKKQTEIFRSKKDIGIVFTNVYHIDEEGCIFEEREFELEFQNRSSSEIAKYFFFSYSKSPPPPLTTEMVRKSVYKDIGDYDENLYGLNDRDLLLRAIKEFDIYIITEHLHFKRYHAENASSNQMELNQDRVKLTEKMLEDFKFLKKFKGERYSYLYFQRAKIAFKNDKLMRGTVAIFRSLKMNPKNVVKQSRGLLERKIY